MIEVEKFKSGEPQNPYSENKATAVSKIDYYTKYQNMTPESGLEALQQS
jgi:hypothetical protein